MVKLNNEALFKNVRANFAHATLNFMFIIAFVNVFQWIFGAENSIVGVIFTIMMSASMVRDMTATPVKHLLIQAAVLLWMGTSAFLVNTLPPLAAFPVNLLTVFFILYAFTYEYSSHMYFPYILSYLFLIFISPVTAEGLPKRLLGLLAGAVCVILYQLFMGRRRAAETARDVLCSMADDAVAAITYLLTGEGEAADPEKVHRRLFGLSQTVYDRRKKALCVSDAGFSMIDAGRGLEHIVLLLVDQKEPLTPEMRKILEKTGEKIGEYRAYISQEGGQLAPPAREDFACGGDERAETDFYNALLYLHNHLLHLSDPQKRTHYRKTVLSVTVRLKAALDVSPVRVLYALRVAFLLSVFTLAVQVLALPHGKWLLFTLASLSVPYADDVKQKTGKRLMATVAGGLFSVALYSMIPSMAGRTAVMMLSGYLSFYCAEYTGTFTCSTIGALGGAVFMTAFGWSDVGTMAAVRLGYVCVGAALAVAANCLLFPYKRGTATRQLLKKYAATTELLTRVCRERQVDTQLYYSLVIQAHLLEAKLLQNARAAGWDQLDGILVKCRAAVRHAHRNRAAALGW
ncbi:FUSC family protein [Enterocloster lavalensis]|uniref:FUSC family protein n=1 Tax=Enterocloster lavalensis TaxID=460384 RepID=UPI0023F490A4|nr:FUSC family protein [Enterocloster lavalensis]